MRYVIYPHTLADRYMVRRFINTGASDNNEFLVVACDMNLSPRNGYETFRDAANAVASLLHYEDLIARALSRLDTLTRPKGIDTKAVKSLRSRLATFIREWESTAGVPFKVEYLGGKNAETLSLPPA